MAEVYSTTYPEQRVYIGDVSVKFRDGVAEVSDEVAEALLALGGFESALPQTVPAVDSEAAIVEEVERRVAAELERIAGEAAAEIEAEDERRVAEAIGQAASTEDGDKSSEGDGATEPEKRKPGRPRKVETAE